MPTEEATPDCPTYPELWPGRWSDRRALLVLLLVAGLIRLWVLWWTVVPARDGIGFIRYAVQMERDGVVTTVRETPLHPGYPAVIWAVSLPVRGAFGLDGLTMQFSAQLASALAGWLLVVPMFSVGKQIFTRWVGFWAALLFQCLPVSGPLLSDAVSDSLYLLLAATAVAFAVAAFRDRVPAAFAAAGLCSGLAYLVRPEAVLLPVAFCLALFGLQLYAPWRRPWRGVVLASLCLTLAAAAPAVPYCVAIGGLTPKPSLHEMLGAEQSAGPAGVTPAAGGPALFAIDLKTGGGLSSRIVRGFLGFGGEYVHAYLYVGWLPALLGLWWCRDRYREVPGTWALLAVLVLHIAAVWWLAVTRAYVSERHVLMLVLATSFQVVAATGLAPVRLNELARTRGWSTSRWLPGPRAAAVAVCLLAVFAAVGLARTLRPLHPHRLGYQLAGRWLAEEARPFDVIYDDHRWAHYYAGRVFERAEGITLPEPPGARRYWYVVIGRASERRAPSHRRTVREADMVRRGGRVVFQWPHDAPVEEARVVVYKVARS